MKSDIRGALELNLSIAIRIVLVVILELVYTEGILPTVRECILKVESRNRIDALYKRREARERAKAAGQEVPSELETERFRN